MQLPPSASNKFAPATSSGSSRLPSLDGLRAFAILIVMVTHANGTKGFHLPASFKTETLGVGCFFVLSGFLITYLLQRESQSNGQIALRGFYFRRMFRIAPAFAVFVLGIIWLCWLGILPLRWEHLTGLDEVMDFAAPEFWSIGHLWSLVVQELFYLLWPLCIVKLGWSRAAGFAIAAFLTVPPLRVATWHFLPEYRSIITMVFPSDSIATGCLLALFRDQLWKSPSYRALLNSPAFILIPVIAVYANGEVLVGHSVRNVAVALCVDWCLRHPVSVPGRVLNFPALVWLGTISYSVYLWQQVFLNRHSSALFCTFPVNFMLVLIVASASYYLIERPSSRLRSILLPSPVTKLKAAVPAANVPAAGV